MSGFILLHRGWRDNSIFRGEFSRADAWIWLIEHACWKPTKFDVNGKTVTLERGQLCTSREQLAKAWEWSPSGVERIMTRLKTEHMIGRETGQGRSVITICNYAKYQDVPAKAGLPTGQAKGQRPDSDRTAKEQGNKNIPLSNDNGAANFWSFATAYLGEARRPLIGKWCRDYGQTEAAQAITAAQLANAADPPAYIEKTLRKTANSAGEIW